MLELFLLIILTFISMGKTLKKVRNLLCISLLPIISMAQSIDPPPPPPPDGIDPPPAAPIDEYLPLVFLLGVVYVWYFFYKQNINNLKNDGK